MNGAEYLCRSLEQAGVDTVFGLFGDIQTEFAHAIGRSKINWVSTFNEKSGGFMADIYARVSKKPGVVYTTLGPGATNLTSALANATQDRSPLIAISDQVHSGEFGLETHQFIDLERAFSPETGITKFSATARSVSDIPELVGKAIVISTHEPQGAVHLSIPADLYAKELRIPCSTFNLEKYGYFKHKGFEISELKKRLSGDDLGLVIAGGLIERQGLEDEFAEFVKRFDLPVLTTFRGKNSIESNNFRNIGTISRHLGELLPQILSKMRYLVTIGYDYNEGVKPDLWKQYNLDVYNINSHDNRVEGVFQPKSLFGDPREILKELFGNADLLSKDLNIEALRKMVGEKIRHALDVEDVMYHPGRIVDAVNDVYSKNSVIICDIGLNKYYSGLLLNSTLTNQIIFSNGMSSMAFTSGALGAKIAAPDKSVVALVGDGGFFMDPQEVITAVRYKKPIVWAVFNNGGLGLVEQAQLKNGDSHHGVRFNKVGIAQLAEGMGAKGISLQPGEDVGRALREARDYDRPVVLDIPVKYRVR